MKDLINCIGSLNNDEYSIIRFGSSIYGKINKVMDIDILILTKRTSVYSDFKNQLLGLRKSLLDGQATSGFDADILPLKAYISESVTTRKIKGYIPVPVFKVGPFQLNKINDGYTVYLHFKGPITIDQFSSYCIYFPLHAMAIIHNHKILVGEFNVKFFNSFIDINKEEFTQWCIAIKKRINSSASKIAAIKAYRKLALQYSLFKGYPISHDPILFANIKMLLAINEDIYPEDLVSLSYVNIKLLFTLVYDRILISENIRI